MAQFKILVVDDDDDTREFLTTVLQSEGFSVTSAADGQEALTSIDKEKPHLIVLDLVMPGLPGQEVCRIIRTDPKLRDIEIFVLSARSDIETKVACFAIGANEYLVKPIDPLELTMRIWRIIRMMKELQRGGDRTSPPESRDPASIIRGSSNLALNQPQYGDYLIEALVGGDAIGNVYKAYDVKLERFAAVKILSADAVRTSEFIQQFRQRAQVLASLNHPGIPRVYHFGGQREEYFFATEWCAGGSLANLIRKEGRLQVHQSIDIILQCAEALLAATRRGVFHGNIKPNTIVFDEDRRVRIVDFALTGNMQLEKFLGTPAFMAPEQSNVFPADLRSDIYSLGIAFYYMLYGILPFSGDSQAAIASKPFPPYDDLGGTIPREVYEIIQKMTQEDPELRYAGYESLITDLENARTAILKERTLQVPRATDVSNVPDVQSAGFFELLATLYKEGTSGVLTVQWSSLQKKFLIRQREIILFESDQQEENIWNRLLNDQLIKKDDIPSNRENLEHSLNSFLLSHTLPIKDFEKVYHQLMKEAITQVLQWPYCIGKFAGARIENEAFANIRMSDILLEAARSLVDYQTVKSHLPKKGLISRTPLFEELLSPLNMTAEEGFLAYRFEGEDTTLDTLQMLTGFAEENILRFAYLLEKIGAVEFRTAEIKPAQAKPPSSERPQISAKAEMKDTSSKRVERVPFDSSRKTMEPHLPESGRRFVEMPKETSHPEKSAARLEEAAVRMDVLRSKTELEIERKMRSAEQFYGRAEKKFEEGDYWKTAYYCQEAIKNHEDARYFHLLALAYAQHPKFQKDAEDAFHKAVALAPFDAGYHVDLARFYMERGLFLRGRTHSEKAVGLAPEDERANDLYDQFLAKKLGSGGCWCTKEQEQEV